MDLLHSLWLASPLSERFSDTHSPIQERQEMRPKPACVRWSSIRISSEETRVARIFHFRGIDDHERLLLVAIQPQRTHFLGVKDRDALVSPWCPPRPAQSLLHGILDELLRNVRHPVQREAVAP